MKGVDSKDKRIASFVNSSLDIKEFYDVSLPDFLLRFALDFYLLGVAQLSNLSN